MRRLASIIATVALAAAGMALAPSAVASISPDIYTCTPVQPNDQCSIAPAQDGAYSVSVTMVLKPYGSCQWDPSRGVYIPEPCLYQANLTAPFYVSQVQGASQTYTCSPPEQGQSGAAGNNLIWSYPNVPMSLTCTGLTLPALPPTSFGGSEIVNCSTGPGDDCGEFNHHFTVTQGQAPPSNVAADFTTSTNDDGSTHFDASASTGNGVSYHWDFGPHVAAADTTVPTIDRTLPLGTTTVTLTVTDSSRHHASASHDVTNDTVIVNSSGDGDDTDTSDALCSTGATITGGAAECTLRAAITQADATDGVTAIHFAIPGSPHITVATPLPQVTRGLTIDGTTQSGKWVTLEGPGTDTGTGIELKDGTSTVRGMAIWGFKTGIVVDDGTDDVIAGNRIGTDAAGTADHGMTFGIGLRAGTGTTIGGTGTGDSNQIVSADSQTAVAVAVTGTATGTSVVDNLMNTTTDGTATLGSGGGYGIDAHPSGTVTLSGNTISARAGGVVLKPPLATGSIVQTNNIGVAGDGHTVLTGPTFGVYVDGVPGATVTGNTVVSSQDDIVVSGRDTTAPTGKFLAPTDTDTSGSVGGTTDTVSNNTVGSLLDSATPVSDGISVWNGATGATVTDNVVSGHNDAHILVIGGTGDKIYGNHAGVSADGRHPASSTKASYGIRIQRADDVTVGAGDDVNLVGNNITGISIDGTTAPSTDVTVAGNDLGVGINGTSPIANNTGISVGNATGTTVGGGNLVYFNGTGVKIVGSKNTSVTDNKIGAPTSAASSGTGNDVGIFVSDAGDVPTGLVLGPNDTVGGIDGDGIRIQSGTVAVTHEHIGIDTSGNVRSNTGYGIRVASGAHADVSASEVADNVGGGIQSSDTGTAGVLGTSIHDVGGNGIEAHTAPAAPTITAAIPVAGGTPRTWVVVSGGTPNSAGILELFANHSCTSAQGFTPLPTSLVAFGSTGAAVVVLKGDNATAPNLTATLTSTGSVSSTSPFSNCVVPAAADDTDGDGIPDVVEAVLGVGAEHNPQLAILPDDSGNLTTLLTSNGTLTDVTPADVDATAPTGVSIQHLVGFSIAGLTAGQATTVHMLTHDTGMSWWRYGQQVAGGSTSWYEWNYNPDTDLGAELITPGEWVLHLRDGYFGDDDFVSNGVIHDPGGPAVDNSPTGDPSPPPSDPGQPPTSPTSTPTPSSTPAAPEQPSLQAPALASDAGTDGAVTVHWTSQGATSFEVTSLVTTGKKGARPASANVNVTSLTSGSFHLQPGERLSVSVVAINGGGRSTATTATVIAPLDQSALHYTGAWRLRHRTADWQGSDQRGRIGAKAHLSLRSGVLTLIGTRCPTCGSIAVSVAGHRIGVIHERGSTAHRVALGTVTIPTALKSRRVTLVVKRHHCTIDGLAMN